MKILSWNSGAYLCIPSLSLRLPIWRSAVDVYSSVKVSVDALHLARVTSSDVRPQVQNCDVINADTKNPLRWEEESSAAHRRESNTCLVSERPADWQWCRMIGSLFCVLTSWTRVKIWADPIIQLYVLVRFVPTHLLVKRTNGKWKEDSAPCTSTSTGQQLNYFILKHNTPSLLLTSCIIIGGDSL